MTLLHGYFSGQGYTFGAYAEQSPERLATVALLRSQRPPDLAGSFQMLDIGCGQGFNLCLQAAAYPQARFTGIDINTDHIAHARSLARAAGLGNVRFLEGDFLSIQSQFGELREQFDFAVAHGILGWVGPQVGDAMLALSAWALRPGGLFYLSYDTLPGWLPMLPFQHAVRSFMHRLPDGLPSLQAAISLFRELRDSQAQVFPAQPALTSRLDAMDTLDPAYLLHEYNHQQWQPQFSNAVIGKARQLGFHYLGSANLAENFDGLLPQPFRQLLQNQPDEEMKELVRDLLLNQAFRRDVYAKGRDPIWALEASNAVRSLRLLRLVGEEPLNDEKAFHFSLSSGEVQGRPERFRQLVESLGEAPISIEELLKANPETPEIPELLQNLTLLLSKGWVCLVPPTQDHEPARRFNAFIAASVTDGGPYRAVAAPVAGNLQQLSDIDLMALHAHLQGWPIEDLATIIQTNLQLLNRSLQRDGQALTGEALTEELAKRALGFRDRILPLLRRIGAVA
ncbi:MAG: class I SAM-dependent methyltransferase [Synechococcaceae cyanobacterium]|nr:class I SAM-dependent methyltransferase [Synechococcaceae cyanobacterium]